MEIPARPLLECESRRRISRFGIPRAPVPGMMTGLTWGPPRMPQGRPDIRGPFPRFGLGALVARERFVPGPETGDLRDPRARRPGRGPGISAPGAVATILLLAVGARGTGCGFGPPWTFSANVGGAGS